MERSRPSGGLKRNPVIKKETFLKIAALILGVVLAWLQFSFAAMAFYNGEVVNPGSWHQTQSLMAFVLLFPSILLLFVPWLREIPGFHLFLMVLCLSYLVFIYYQITKRILAFLFQTRMPASAVLARVKVKKIILWILGVFAFLLVVGAISSVMLEISSVTIVNASPETVTVSLNYNGKPSVHALVPGQRLLLRGKLKVPHYELEFAFPSGVIVKRHVLHEEIRPGISYNESYTVESEDDIQSMMGQRSGWAF